MSAYTRDPAHFKESLARKRDEIVLDAIVILHQHECSRDRWVCAPHSLSAGTLTSPRLSDSLRVVSALTSTTELIFTPSDFVLSLT